MTEQNQLFFQSNDNVLIEMLLAGALGLPILHPMILILTTMK
jgi:hypothetical protein